MTDELDESERRALRRKVRAATLDALHALGGEATRREVVAWVFANGEFTARELAAQAPEVARDRFDRLVDHQLAWALTNLKRDGLVENPRWSTWRLAGAAAEPVAPVAEPVVSAERLAELRTMPYRRYLRSPEWRRTRAAALLRAGNRCALDAGHTDDLEVHHNSYARLGEELPADVVVLCRACHRLHHQANGRPRPQRREPSLADFNAPPVQLHEKLVVEAKEQRKPPLLRRLLRI